MKTGLQQILYAAIALIFFAGCSEEGFRPEQDFVLTEFSLNADMATKASSDIGTPTHSVDRILVIPFQKVNPSLPNTRNDNFVPVWSYTRQIDIAKFPANSLSIGLDASKTYKVLVVGFNHADYNHATPTASTNRFTILTQPTPTTLANFQLNPKLPNNVPEFFICYLSAANGSTTIGTVFTPADGIKLSGRLGRIISALAVKVTGIPSYVKSISLVAENMVKAIRVADTTASVVQVPGDNESRIIRTQNVSGNSVDFGEYLLPTGQANKMRLYLDVALGTLTQRYQITSTDPAVVVSNQFIFYPNHAIKISGNYNSINYGFVVTLGINLEDNTWDGIVPNPGGD